MRVDKIVNGWYDNRRNDVQFLMRALQYLLPITPGIQNSIHLNRFKRVIDNEENKVILYA